MGLAVAGPGLLADEPIRMGEVSTAGLAALRTRRPDAVGGFIAAFVVLYLVALNLPGQSERQELWIADFAAVIADAVAVFFAGSAAIARKGRARVGWAFVSVAALGFGAGDALWTWYELALNRDVPSPGWVDVGYVGMPPLMFVGLTVLLGRPGYLKNIWSAATAAAVVLAVAAVVWTWMLRPVYVDSEISLAAKIVNGFYPLGDLVLVTAIMGALWRAPRGRPRAVLALVAIGLCGMVAADTAYALVALDDGYVSGDVIDLGWIAGILLIGYAGWIDRRWRCDFRDTAEDIIEPLWLQSLPLFLLPLVISIANPGTLLHGWRSDPVLATLVGTAILLVIVRQVALLTDNLRLNRRLVRARDELERRVEERTRDVTEAEARFRQLTESSADGIFTCDNDGRILFWNRAAERMFGWSADSVIGRAFVDLVPSHARPELLHQLARMAATDAPVRAEPLEIMGFRRGGREFPVEVSISSWIVDGHRFFGAIMRDITERRRHEEQLRYFAESDALTGLLNRRRLEHELEREMALVPRGAAGALFFMDLDRFKGINDNLGHRAGDDMLVSIAGLLRRVFDGKAQLARLGGDEFAMLAPGVEAAEAEQLALEVMQAVRSNSIEAFGQRISVTASIGIALYPPHATTADELLVRADQAMYRAKELRDRIRMYTAADGEDPRLGAHRPWEQRIREALETDGFVLHYQPIADHGGNVRQCEALVRLIGDNGELVLPGAFLDTAERSGLIHALDRWVLTHAIREVAARHRTGDPLVVEVNLSGLAFGDAGLVELIEDLLTTEGLPPSSLVVEITETAAIADLDQARLFIQKLRAIGCQFALDDFGVGFSSFYALKQLPVDYLKIDGSFIRNLASDPVDQQLVRAISQMARALGKRTIAEFVADSESATLLRHFGIDFLQGYFVGRPMPFTPTAVDAAQVRLSDRLASQRGKDSRPTDGRSAA